jgi:heme-degrading monooxygenase HmoA
MLNEATLEYTNENTITAADGANFVAINAITCDEGFRPHFERMFKSRAGAIDRMPGFISMEVLKPNNEGAYLIISRWKDEAAFQGWMNSSAFLEGHRRGFSEMQQYKARGEAPPLKSDFSVYRILTD